MAEPLLSIEHISKTFPGVKALDDVSLSFLPGEVHAIVGENGAGKSTLIKILAGATTPTEGRILFDQSEVSIGHPTEGLKLGISVIYQELTLLPELSVAENIFLNRQPRSGKGTIDYSQMHKDAENVLRRLNVDIDTHSDVGHLRIAEQQLVEIARGISAQARVVIMDEPTDALTEQEAEVLFEVIDDLKQQNILVIYITHRLKEVFEIADRVTVLKDGQKVDTLSAQQTDSKQLARLMVGRPISDTYPESSLSSTEPAPLLKVEGVSTRGIVRDISFSLRNGEIIGLAGLVGSGRTELVHALFGFEPVEKGQMYIKQREVVIGTPMDAINAGMGYVTSDRKEEGLILQHTIKENMALPSLDDRQRMGFINRKNEQNVVADMIDKLTIRPPSANQIVNYLSGGNQQKVVLAKWLLTNPDILLFNEPTRGIDIGAKEEIYKLMRTIADTGTGILMISSELPEVLGMSDRILVMHRGRLSGRLNREEATEEAIMLLATGQTS